MGAAASALVYSITETVLLNHLKPYAYLTYILDELRKMGAFPKEEELKKLLPWSEDLPEYCRTKLKNNTKSTRGQTPMWSTLRQLRGILANILQCKLQNKSVYDRKQLLFCWKSEDS